MHTKTFLDTKKSLGPYAKHFTLIKINDIEYNNYFEKIGYVLKQEINYNQIYIKK